jgi:hypothetical protein
MRDFMLKFLSHCIVFSCGIYAVKKQANVKPGIKNSVYITLRILRNYDFYDSKLVDPEIATKK